MERTFLRFVIAVLYRHSERCKRENVTKRIGYVDAPVCSRPEPQTHNDGNQNDPDQSARARAKARDSAVTKRLRRRNTRAAIPDASTMSTTEKPGAAFSDALFE